MKTFLIVLAIIVAAVLIWEWYGNRTTTSTGASIYTSSSPTATPDMGVTASGSVQIR
jgi:hypothetical protein